MDRRFHPSPAAATALLLFLSLTAAVSATGSSGDDGDHNQCVYTVYVRTGSVIKGGTDSGIGLTLGDADGREVSVPDLREWGGLGGEGYDYFERGARDAFSGRGPCGLKAPLCRLNITSDGAGAHHGWFCEYVEVTATGPHVPCTQTLFYVGQWLATDAAPYKLYATVDGCDQVQLRGGQGAHFVVGKPGSGSGSESVADGSTAASASSSSI